MRKLTKIVATTLAIGFASVASAGILLLSGNNNEPTGWILNYTSMGTSSTNNVATTKTGDSCSISILNALAIGNATVEKAKKDAHITQVASVDNTAFNVLGVFGYYCTVVHGE